MNRTASPCGRAITCRRFCTSSPGLKSTARGASRKRHGDLTLEGLSRCRVARLVALARPEPRVSSFRKWIARRLRVLHTHAGHTRYAFPPRQASELAEGQKNAGV